VPAGSKGPAGSKEPPQQHTRNIAVLYVCCQLSCCFSLAAVMLATALADLHLSQLLSCATRFCHACPNLPAPERPTMCPAPRTVVNVKDPLFLLPAAAPSCMP
jgi:hypothetical protein